MLIARLGCLFFGATICLGVPSFYLDQSTKVKRSAAFKATEKSMLQALGLQSRPTPEKGSKEKVPQFILDLYHNHVNDPEWISTDFRKEGKWTTANTIRAFHDEADGHPLAQTSGLPNRWNLFFDVSTHPNHETLTASELRLSFSANKSSSGKGVAEEEHRVIIFQVLQPGTAGHPAITRLIDTKVTAAEGVESFDIRPAVNHWLLNPKENYGLEVHSVTNKDSPTVHLNKDATAPVDERPSLVTFSHDGAKHVYRRRRKRRSTEKTKEQQYCQRHPLYVDFLEVGWNDWIVAPPGYEAFYCNGGCPFPIADHLNTTNHAIVQTLMNSANSADVPRACCVPTTLNPISMLYLDEYKKVVLKNYQDMVVDGCGCR